MADIESIQQQAENSTCESCGAQHWHIQEGTQALVSATDDGLDLSGGAPVHTVICDSCGYIRLYSTLVGGD